MRHAANEGVTGSHDGTHGLDERIRIRELDDEERLTWRPAVDAWMDLPGGHDCATTFPLLWGSRSRARTVGAFEGDALLASATSRIALVAHGGPGSGREANPGDRALAINPSALDPIAFVGTVTCAPRRRGEGLASAVLAALLRADAADGARHAVLWSGRSGMYRRLGFEPTGTELAFEVPLHSLADHLPESTGITRPVHLEDLGAIADLHDRKPAGVERTAEHWFQAIGCRGLEAFVRTDLDGRVLAYAMRNKGADFAGWWHEFGGPDDVVLDLVAEVVGAESVLVAQAGSAHPGLDGPEIRSGLILPPYRQRLAERLRGLRGSRETSRTSALTRPCGPDVERLGPTFFVDGLDSV